MIQIADHLLPKHDVVLSDYLRGAGRLTREQWQRLREAIDLLAQSTVTVQGREYTFTWFYETFIYLLTFCLYWWSAFAVGYAFEVEIFRDLRAEGIEFFAHDITNRNERLSPFDLTVLGLRGDVKYSTWFLTVENARLAGLDFFITRLYDESGAVWLRVVLLTPFAQELIGEVTMLATPAESAPPLPATVMADAAQLLLIRYEDWKARVRFKQTPQGDKNQ
jgi:hypothetical protein